MERCRRMKKKWWVFLLKNLKWPDYQNALQVKSHNYPPLILNNLISRVRRDNMWDVYRISFRFLINNQLFRNYLCSDMLNWYDNLFKILRDITLEVRGLGSTHNFIIFPLYPFLWNWWIESNCCKFVHDCCCYVWEHDLHDNCMLVCGLTC
jgi:hypothetical protein